MSLWTTFLTAIQAMIPPAEGTFGIVILIWVGFRAIRQSIRVTRRLAEEQQTLEQCREALAIADRDGIHIDQQRVESWLEQAPVESAVTRAIQTAWAARNVSNPDLEAISTMLAQSEAAQLSFARSAPNLLLLSGLLGTVFGLAGMVGSLGPQIQGTLETADPLTLTRNLGITLQHMQGAFACTLWGIISAVGVSLWTRRISAQQSDFLADVQEFVIREFAPAIFPQAQSVQMEGMRQLLIQSQRFLKQIASIMGQSATFFQEVLQNAGEAMTKSVNSLDSVATGMQQSLTRVAGDVQTSAQALQTSTDQVRESTAALKTYHSDLRNAYVEMRRMFDESQQHSAEVAEAQLKEIGKLGQHFDASSQEILVGVQRTTEHLTTSTTAFTEAGDRFTAQGDRVSLQLAQGFERLTENLNGVLCDHRSEMGHVDDGVRLVAERLQEISERLDPRMLPKEEWTAVRAALEACVVELQRLSSTSSPHPTTTAGSDLSRAVFELTNQLTALRVSSGTVTVDTPDMGTHLAQICTTLQEYDPRPHLQDLAASLEAIKVRIAPAPDPTRRYLWGIALPRWFPRQGR